MHILMSESSCLQKKFLSNKRNTRNLKKHINCLNNYIWLVQFQGKNNFKQSLVIIIIFFLFPSKIVSCLFPRAKPHEQINDKDKWWMFITVKIMTKRKYELGKGRRAKSCILIGWPQFTCIMLSINICFLFSFHLLFCSPLRKLWHFVCRYSLLTLWYSLPFPWNAYPFRLVNRWKLEVFKVCSFPYTLPFPSVYLFLFRNHCVCCLRCFLYLIGFHPPPPYRAKNFLCLRITY